MLGSFLDRIFIACSDRSGNLPLEIESHTSRSEYPGHNWVCFMPEFCYRTGHIRKKLILENINMEVYILPKTAIQPDPGLTHDFLDSVLGSAIKKQSLLYPGRRVNVLGISLGNVLAFRFAEHFKVNGLVSVVPGSRLAECIWESAATGEIAQKSGKSLDDYKKSLSDYNPIESVPRINPQYSEVHLGTCDLMIPYARGEELAKAMQQRFRVNLSLSRFSGHVETIFYFSRQFSRIAPHLAR